MSNKQTFFIALIFLATITACVIPGLPTASAPVFVPTVDTSPIETRVAGTVSAAIAQTEQAQPTSTPIPSFTSTPAPTSTPAYTATVTPEVNPSQSTLTKQEDGSILFIDQRAGYQVKLPSGLLAVRVNEQEYLDAFSLEEAADTNIQQSLLSVQTEDPNTFRLLAIDTNTAHIQNDFVTDIRFVLDEQKTISLSSDADLKAIAETVSTSATVFRFEVTALKIITSASGIKFGVIEARSSFTNTAGADVAIHQEQVFFNVKAGTQSILFTTIADLKDTTLPAFDSILETIRLNAE